MPYPFPDGWNSPNKFFLHKSAVAPCAQCAPETLAEPSTTASVRGTLFRARVKLHEHRPREVDFMFRLVRAESAGVRGDGLMYRLNERASCARSFSKSYKPDSSAERNPDPAGPSLSAKTKETGFSSLSPSGLRGSDPPPQPWQGCALPNELNPRMPPVGIEPTTREFSIPCSTN